MDVKTRMSFQPLLHFGMLVGRVVVDDEVNVEVLRDRPVNLPKKPQIFLMPMPLLAPRRDFSADHIQRGEQTARSMSYIIMGPGSVAPFAHRQARLRAIEGLNPAPLVHAQHQGVFGGFRYNPTTSRTLGTKLGSVDNLNVRSRCGLI